MNDRTIHVPRRESSDPRVKESPHPTRAQEEVHPPVHTESSWDAPWTPPSNLVVPEPLAGMSQRWVRVSIHGEDDPSNVAKAMQEGWRPRKADTVPESVATPRITEGRWTGCIGVHGMILCHMPTERVKARQAYYEGNAARMAQAVEAELQAESDPSMPIQQKRATHVAVGGRRPKGPSEAGEGDS